MAKDTTRVRRRDEGERPVACNDLNGEQRQPNQRQFCAATGEVEALAREAKAQATPAIVGMAEQAA